MWLSRTQKETCVITTARAALIAAAVAATITLTACGGDDDATGMPGMDHGQSTSTASATAATASEFNPADVMFAQMMIPHHQQAVDMSDMLLAKSGVDPQVTALAEQIKAAQQPEIDTMNSWLDAWGRTHIDDGGMHHGGADDGMMTEEEMRTLDKASGSDGQRLYLDGMIKHHTGAIKMAEAEIASGKNTEAITLAKNIAETQQQEIATMTELLTKI
jgi:uncharacterized protein (DUF305 family)